MRLIDVDAFIARFDQVPMVQEAIRKVMDTMPTIEERKKGFWLWDRGARTCSVCGQMRYIGKMNTIDHYCPNCGADMKGEQE